MRVRYTLRSRRYIEAIYGYIDQQIRPRHAR